MKKIPTNKILAAGIGVVLFTILLVLAVSLRQSQRVRNTTKLVNRNHEVLQHIQKIIVAAVDNETGARGYVITGQEPFLQPLVSSVESLKHQLILLKQMMTDRRHSALLDSMRIYISKRIVYSDSMVMLRRQQGLSAATVNMVERGTGKLYTDHIRRLGDQMEVIENEVLAEGKKQSDDSITELNMILYIMLLAVLLLGMVLVRRIKKDIDQRIQSEEKFRALLNAAPDATVMVNEAGQIQMMNLQMERLFGYTAAELAGRPVEILIPAELKERHIHHRGHFVREAGVRAMGAGLELKAVKKDGSTFPVEISLSPIHTSFEGLLVSASIRDITERKKTEEEIRKLNTELELRVKERTQDLQKTLREIADYKYALDESSIVAITSQKGIITYVNDNFCRISKYSREELIGQDHRIINSGFHPKIYIRNLWTTIARGSIWRGEIKNRAKDGSYYWVDTTIIPFLNEQGKPYQYVAIRADITPRKEAEEKLVKNERIYRTIASSIPGSVICLFDTDLRYILIEGDMLEKLGYSKSILLGNRMEDVLAADVFAQVHNDFTRVLGGQIVTRENSQEGYDTISRLIPLKDEQHEVYAIMTVTLDITELKKAQRNITELNRGLEEKIVLRTEQLRKSNAEMEAFSYSVSHDLRAPLRGIIAFSEILEEEYGSRLDDEAKRITGIIRNSAMKMGNLIDDLLAFSRMGKRELNKVNISMLPLVQETITELLQHTGRKNITWKVHGIHPAIADVSTIRQVWVNLISNAIKYSANRQQPVIEISSYTENDETVFFIRDNGAGFDEAYKDKLFKVFQRLHDTDEFEGTGVGLALVEKIISRHGGKVWAEGKVNEGACFYFSLPLTHNKYES